MAAIDSLLRLIAMQKAEGLVLNTNKAPALIQGGTPRLLSMPPLGPTMMETFLREALTEAQLEALQHEPVEALYRSEKDGPFSVKARLSGDRYVVTFRPSSGRASTALTISPVGDGAASEGSPPPGATGEAPDEDPPVRERTARETGPHDPDIDAERRRPRLPPETQRSQEPPLLAPLLEHALTENASDLIVSAGAPPALRIHGDWQMLPGTVVTDALLLDLLEPALTPTRRQALEETGSVDLGYVLPLGDGERRFRVNLFRQTSGLSAAFRPIRDEAPTLAQLNLPETLKSLVELPYGLVLVTGPTGSGKSTTLAALIDHINRTRARHVITLEDPIEFVYRRRRSIIHQREVGTHVESFASGLRAALRESPDVILVGEMRDRETIAAALSAAETGHLVLSTLHTGSAPMAIDRIVDVFPEHQQNQIRTQLAGALRTVVTQRLLPGLNGGRAPAVEILHITYAVAALIRDRKVYQIPTQMQVSREEGMLSFEQSLAELVRTGRISRDTAARATADVTQLKEWLKER